MCILLNVKKHEKTFALNVDIFNIEKNAKKCMTNDKIYAILIIVYCSLCKWSMGHSAERKHYGLFCCFPFQYTGSRINN